MFAILGSDGMIPLEARGHFARRMEAAGSRIVAMQGGRSMGCRTLPEDAPDDPECACDRARPSLAEIETAERE